MRRTLQSILVFLACLPALAGADFKAGQAAYQAGNYPQAAELWLAAAKAGNADAMYELGKLYGEGLGVLQNFTQSHAFFNLAASKGHRQALQARAVVEDQMTAEERAGARKLASRYLKSWSSGTPETTAAPATQPSQTVARASPTAAGGQRTLVLVSFMKVLPKSSSDVRKLAREWPQITRDLVTGELGEGWQVVPAEDDYNLYSGRRKDKRVSTLCRQYSGDRLLVLRFPATQDDEGFGGYLESNWKRNLELASFDCETGEQTAKKKQQIEANNDGWPVEKPIQLFIRQSKLVR